MKVSRQPLLKQNPPTRRPARLLRKDALDHYQKSPQATELANMQMLRTMAKSRKLPSQEYFPDLVKKANSSDTRIAQPAVARLTELASKDPDSAKGKQAMTALLASGQALESQQVEFLTKNFWRLDRSQRGGAIKVLGDATARLSENNEKYDTAPFRKFLRAVVGNKRIQKSAVEAMTQLKHKLETKDYDVLARIGSEAAAGTLRHGVKDGRVDPQRVANMLSLNPKLPKGGQKLLLEVSEHIKVSPFVALPNEVAQKILRDPESPPHRRAYAILPLLKGKQLPKGVNLKELETLAKKLGHHGLKEEVTKHRKLATIRAKKAALKLVQAQIENLGTLRTEKDRLKVVALRNARKRILSGEIPNVDNPPDVKSDPSTALLWSMVYEVPPETALGYLKDVAEYKMKLTNVKPGLKQLKTGLATEVFTQLTEAFLVKPIFGDNPLAQAMNNNLWASMGKIASKTNILTLVATGWLEGTIQGVKALNKLSDTVDRAYLTSDLWNKKRNLEPKTRDFLSENRRAIETLTGERMPNKTNLHEYLMKHRGKLLLRYGQAGNTGAPGSHRREYDPIPAVALEELKRELTEDLLKQDREISKIR